MDNMKPWECRMSDNYNKVLEVPNNNYVTKLVLKKDKVRNEQVLIVKCSFNSAIH